MNTRVWKWLAIMKGYSMEIQHIPGEVNPADYLPSQSLDSAIMGKEKAKAKYAQYIERMKIPPGATDGDIQAVLSNVIERD